MPAKRFEEFFKDLDETWKNPGNTKIPIRIFGAAALHLRTDTVRATRDADILEVKEMTPTIHLLLEKAAGQGSLLYRRHGIYLQIVKAAIPMLPQKPGFHVYENLKNLKNFSVSVLAPVEVAVSKLMRYNARDIADIQYLIKGEIIAHAEFIRCVEKILDYYSMDARADDFPKLIKRVHELERDFFQKPETKFDLPGWI